MYRNIAGLAGLFSGKSLFWITLLLFFGTFLYLFSDICSSFIIGFLLAYMCAPTVKNLSKYVDRGIASFVFTISAVVFFIIITINVFPLLAEYFTTISENAPVYYQKSLDLITQLCSSIGFNDVGDRLKNFRFELLQYLDKEVYLVSSLARGIASQFTAFTGFMSSLVISTLSFFYFLKDWELIKAKCYEYVPIRQKSILQELGKLTRLTFRNFFHGQFRVVSVLAVYYALGLCFIGIKHFIILGAMSGLFSFIPFIGALFSLFITIFVSAMSLSVVDLYCLAGMYLLGQVIEGYVLSPKFVGEKTGLHPLWILFSFFAGFQIKGIIGVVVAIPCVAVINNIVIFSLNKFKANQTYKQ